uniref:Uncharacterized protein n=1 Tax=Coturnix japonica TaxID=93934 RepID=A0A8C2SR60_COTJA
MIIITVLWKTYKNENLPAASEQNQGQHMGVAGSQTQAAVHPLLCLNKLYKHARAQPFTVKQAGHLSNCTSVCHPQPLDVVTHPLSHLSAAAADISSPPALLWLPGSLPYDLRHRARAGMSSRSLLGLMGELNQKLNSTVLATG